MVYRRLLWPVLLLVLATLTLCAGSVRRANAEERTAVDLKNIDRKIQKQPDYHSSRPRYGLLVFGQKRATRVWAVFDKSTADNKLYDVLYFDRNANGDLTDPGERIVGKPQGKETLNFAVGSFKDPATGDVHTEISFQTWLSNQDVDANPFTVDFYVKWQDKHVVHGGFDERPISTCQFTEKPADAPVYWLGGDAPLTVSRWGWDKLAIGQSHDIRTLLGYSGFGRGSFSALPQDYLPADLPILATLVYTDTAGKERRVQAELRERC